MCDKSDIEKTLCQINKWRSEVMILESARSKVREATLIQNSCENIINKSLDLFLKRQDGQLHGSFQHQRSIPK